MAAAAGQKKAPPRRSKPGWLLGCFGFHWKVVPPEGKKAQKSSGRRKLFRLCFPKIRIAGLRRSKKVGLDAKAVAAIKATQSIMFEASKVKQSKLQNHHHLALNNSQDQLKLLPKEEESTEVDKNVQNDQSKNDICRKQGQRPKAKQTCASSSVTKDSVIGVSIMLTTLVILGIWGKLCAILCMSAWFYCVPLLKPVRHLIGEPSEEDRKFDLNSDDHRKKGGIIRGASS